MIMQTKFSTFLFLLFLIFFYFFYLFLQVLWLVVLFQLFQIEFKFRKFGACHLDGAQKIDEDWKAKIK